jgi:hypothetical protein
MRKLRLAAGSFAVTALIGGVLVGAYLYSQPVRERVDRAVASISDQFASANDADPTGGDRDSTDTLAPPDRPVASKDTRQSEPAESDESEPTAEPASDNPKLAKAEAKPDKPAPSTDEPDEATASEADGDDEPATLFGMKIEPGESPDDPQLAEQSEGTGDEMETADNDQPGDGAGDEQLASGQDDEASKPADDEPTRADDGDAQLADAGAGSTGGEPATEQGRGESPDKRKLGPELRNPPRVAFRTKDGKYVSGRVQAFNDRAFRIQTGKDEHKRLAWSKLPPRAVYQAHAQLLDSSAERWMNFGKRLATQHGSEKYAKEALRHAAQLDGSLAKPIKKNWPKWQSKAEKLAQGREHAKHASASPKVSGKPVKLVRDFPCAVNHPVERVGGTGTKNDPAHFKIKFPPGRYEAGFFLFKLDNIKGKTVRVDFISNRAGNWTTLNPVYCYATPDTPPAEDLGNPELFKAQLGEVQNVKKLPQAPNSPKLPDTRGQRWHFIANTGVQGEKNLFSLKHTFNPDPTGRQTDGAYVAMKYPYTPKLANSLMGQMKERAAKMKADGEKPFFKVHKAGESPEGRPLWVVQIGRDKAPRDPDKEYTKPKVGEAEVPPILDKPTILLYAREHADEHDSSWGAQGAIDFLTGSHPDARFIRENCVILVMPLLEPSATRGTKVEFTWWRGVVKEAA